MTSTLTMKSGYNLIGEVEKLLMHKLIGYPDHLDYLCKLQSQTKTTFPPYNIIHHFNDNEDASNSTSRATIELAVTGLGLDELIIEHDVDKHILVVKTVDQTDNEDNRVDLKDSTSYYIHKGLARRNFSVQWKLADFWQITKTDLQNGLLTIDLERIVPDEKKPKNIPIGFNQNAPNKLK
jgi:molecular chaperone IbpA